MPLFSIIIPTYNRETMTRRAIDSVLAQDFKDFELIVVDDGSTDGTRSIPQDYGNKIKYIKQPNSGVSSARNRGIIESRSEWTAFLDSDDTWHSTKLTFHKNYIENNSRIRIHQTEDLWIRNGVRVNPSKKHIKQEGNLFRKSLEMCAISPSSVVMSRSLFDQYGYFDTSLPACEDYDLWLKITAFEEIGLIKEKLMTRYAGHSGQLSSAFWGMDRFRLYSIIRLLSLHGSRLKEEDHRAALNTAVQKAGVLMQGAVRRGKASMASLMEETITLLEERNYTKIDCLSLLEE